MSVISLCFGDVLKGVSFWHVSSRPSNLVLSHSSQSDVLDEMLSDILCFFSVVSEMASCENPFLANQDFKRISVHKKQHVAS